MSDTKIYYELIDDPSQKQSDNALMDFVGEKIRGYQDPAREGTRRGDPIGFSRVKRLCCLLMLANYSLKYISELTGVSYGLLKKWRAEEDFKAQHEKFAQEFVDKVFQDIARLMNVEDAQFVSEFEHLLKGIGRCHDGLIDFFSKQDDLKRAVIRFALLTDDMDWFSFDMKEIEKEGNRQWREQGYIDMPGVRFKRRKLGRIK